MWACGQIYSDYRFWNLRENPISGQVKVQWLTLCYSSLRLWSLCCCGRQHGIHISRVSPENANYGRNQLQTHANSLSLYIFIAHCWIEEWNWKEEMRNIDPKEIQVNNRNKSNCTLSLQKGGQMRGGRSGGSTAIMCDEIFYQIGTHLFSTHIRFQLYPILPVPKLFWPWKWASKLKSHFLRGSFSRLTFKSGGDPV